MRHRVRVRLDLRQQAQERHHVDDPRPRDEPVLTVDGGDEPRMVVVALQPLEEVGVALDRHPALRIEDVDRPHALGFVAPADLEIVEVMRGGDLDRARALFGIGIFVGDDGDQAADQRQANMAADEMLIARVVGVDRDRGVAQHRFGARGGDRQPLAGLLALVVHHRIFEVVEAPIGIPGQRLGERRRVERSAVLPRPLERVPGLDLDDLEIRDRGLEPGVPVDQPFILVDEPLAVELNEHLRDRTRQALVEGEALAAPVAGGAKALELGNDGAARFRLPRPDPLDERLAPHGAAVRLLALHELPLDHHLRGDAGVIDARLPQHVAASHAPVAAQDVLQRVVERMAHMQIAGDVRRRNDDAKGLRLRPVWTAGPERAGFFPKRGSAAFGRGEVERFVHHWVLVLAI